MTKTREVADPACPAGTAKRHRESFAQLGKNPPVADNHQTPAWLEQPRHDALRRRSLATASGLLGSFHEARHAKLQALHEHDSYRRSGATR